MGAVPKQRISKGRQGRRRSHHALARVPMDTCPRCGATKRTHHVCPECGTYAGVPVYEPRKKSSE